MTTFDVALSDLERVDLVKIDVEGFEHEVLRGATQVLAEHHPALVVECNPDGPFREVEEILAQLDYRFFHIRESLVPHDHICPDEYERYRNYLFLPSDHPPPRDLGLPA